jgi:hypothetical protein
LTLPEGHLFFKGYMKAVKAKLQDTNPTLVDPFEKGASAYAKKIIANFKDYEFVSSEGAAAYHG